MWSSATGNISRYVPKPLSAKGMEDVYAGRELTTIEQAGSGDLIRGVVPIFSLASPKEVIGFVTASYYFPVGLVDKINVISKTSEEYRQLTLLKTPIKFGYIITLFIVMLLIIFSATWFGLYLAKGITVPIQDLAEATRRIAQGDLNHQIDIVADDEIGVLVHLFQPDDEGPQAEQAGLEQANLDLEQRRNYTETILRNISAGVISIDGNGIITTINRAAEKMLGIQPQKVLNRPYEEVLIPDHRVLAGRGSAGNAGARRGIHRKANRCDPAGTGDDDPHDHHRRFTTMRGRRWAWRWSSRI